MAQLQATTVNGTVVDVVTENIKTGNHTIALEDRNKVVAMNNTSTASVTIPNDSSVNFPVGSVVFIARVNSGAVNLAAASGVNLSKTGSFGSNEEVYVRKRAANTWIVVDAPSPANVVATGTYSAIQSGFLFTGSGSVIVG